MQRWQAALDDTDEWLTELLTGSARWRMLRLLLKLSEFGDEKGCIWMPTRQEMGAMLDMTFETASRLISALRRENLAQDVHAIEGGFGEQQLLANLNNYLQQYTGNIRGAQNDYNAALNTAYQSAEIEYFVGNAEPAVVVCSGKNFGWVSKIAFKAGTRHCGCRRRGRNRHGAIIRRAHACAPWVDRPYQPSALRSIG